RSPATVADHDVIGRLRAFAPPPQRKIDTANPHDNSGAIAVMERPLSPFMFPTWSRFQITSALSILPRLTGIALAVGSILLARNSPPKPMNGSCGIRRSTPMHRRRHAYAIVT